MRTASISIYANPKASLAHGKFSPPLEQHCPAKLERHSSVGVGGAIDQHDSRNTKSHKLSKTLGGVSFSWLGMAFSARKHPSRAQIALKTHSLLSQAFLHRVKGLGYMPLIIGRQVIT